MSSLMVPTNGALSTYEGYFGVPSLPDEQFYVHVDVRHCCHAASDTDERRRSLRGAAVRLDARLQPLLAQSGAARARIAQRLASCEHVDDFALELSDIVDALLVRARSSSSGDGDGSGVNATLDALAAAGAGASVGAGGTGNVTLSDAASVASARLAQLDALREAANVPCAVRAVDLSRDCVELALRDASQREHTAMVHFAPRLSVVLDAPLPLEGIAALRAAPNAPRALHDIATACQAHVAQFNQFWQVMDELGMHRIE